MSTDSPMTVITLGICPIKEPLIKIRAHSGWNADPVTKRLVACCHGDMTVDELRQVADELERLNVQGTYTLVLE